MNIILFFFIWFVQKPKFYTYIHINVYIYTHTYYIWYLGMCTYIHVYKHTHICKYIAGEKCDFCSLWLFSCLLLLLMSDRTMTLQTMRISYLKKLKLHTSSTSGRLLFEWLPLFWPPQKWGQSWCDGVKRTQAFMWATQGWLSKFRERKQQNAQTTAVLEPKKFSCPPPPGEKSQELGIWTDGIPLVLSAPSCHTSGSSAASLQRSSNVKDKNQFRKQKSVLP